MLRPQRRPLFLFLVPLLLALSACASLGTAPAQTLSQKIAYAVGVHTAVLQAIPNAVKVGTLSSTDAEKVLKLADESRVVLDAARVAMNVGNTTDANNKLALALATLTALQAFLNAHGSP